MFIYKFNSIKFTNEKEELLFSSFSPFLDTLVTLVLKQIVYGKANNIAKYI